MAEPTSSAPVAVLPRRSSIRPPLVRRLWLALSSGFAAFLGLLPHILHHAGPLAGAALFAGVGGSLLFGAIGLVAAVPFLLRIHRRCGNWRVPAGVLALFAAMFAISAFVVGPALSGGGESSKSSTPTSQPNQQAPAGHEAHHGG